MITMLKRKWTRRDLYLMAVLLSLGILATYPVVMLPL